MHGISKGLDPNTQLEKQIVKPLFKETSWVKPRIGQGRAGSRWKKSPINQSTAQSVENSKILVSPKIPAESHKYAQFCNPCAINKEFQYGSN